MKLPSMGIHGWSGIGMGAGKLSKDTLSLSQTYPTVISNLRLQIENEHEHMLNLSFKTTLEKVKQFSEITVNNKFSHC